jgi:hypothetical protein
MQLDQAGAGTAGFLCSFGNHMSFPMTTSEFYDTLAPYYHLIYADWEVSIGRQSRALDAIIRSTGGPQPRSVLDTSCGIGTEHRRGPTRLSVFSYCTFSRQNLS